MRNLFRTFFIYSFFSTSFLFFAFTAFAAAPSNGKWILVGNMTSRRIDFTATLLQNGKVLTAGGRPSQSEPLLSSTELYDPITKTWSLTGNLNSVRMNNPSMFPFMVTLQNGKALIAGGSDTNNNSINTAELYDPTTGSWTYTGNLNTPRRDMSMILLNDGRALIVAGTSGQDSSTSLATSELYNPSTGTWSYTANNLAVPRDGPSLIKLLDGRILLVGGNQADYTCTTTAEIFNPTNNTWSSAGTMPWGAVGITMTLLSNGKVFAAGGNCAGNLSNSAIYDPSTNSWTSTANVPIIPAIASFLLDNGNILVRSGSFNSVQNTTINTSSPVDEIYNPTTNSWDVTNLSIGENEFGSFTQLSNGDVLTAGGWDCNYSIPSCTLNTAELYTSQDLAVPLFKQTNSSWSSQEYDSGELWAGDRGTIGGFGCAMTSAAMVFKYYGITKLPDNTDLDPGTLNVWLKNQADGYVGEGLLNWLALTRLSKLAKLNNPGFMYDGLEFNRSGTDSSTLISDINHGQPDVLEEPGHFIVGKGINGTTFDINDPYYNRSDLNNTAYNNSFLSLERFTPSYTDLSYIMLTVNPNVTLTVKTSTGSAVGTQFIQQPLGDALNNSTPSGKPLKIFYLPKPKTGTYTVTLSSSIIQQYQLGTYLYDINGNVVTTILNGTVSTNNPESFTLSFNTQNTNASSITKIVTFQSTLADITEAESLGQISHGPATALTALLNTAKNSEDKDQTFVVSVKLDSFEGLLYVFRGRGISEDTFQILLYYAEYLKNHL